jgi:predicted AAA+ superfamily ATPase
MLLKRLPTVLLKEYLKKFPIVAVIGARQVGKTTLVRDLLKETRKYLTFDEETVVLTARENPRSFLTQEDKITIDEIQKLPEILPTLKQIVDEKRVSGRFLLTGSANLLLLPKIKETLAGRVVYIELEPLTIFECLKEKTSIPKLIKVLQAKSAENCWKILKQLKPNQVPLKKLIFRGGYPSAWLENNDHLRQAWFKGYVSSYLERDIRDISRIKNLYEYRKFLALAAFRCGQLLSKSDLARDCGISYSTANHFFNLLLSTFQIFIIEPYYKNIGKRLIKAPKLMWTDTGLALHLQGIDSWEELERLGRIGHLLENKIAIELKALLSVFMPLAKLFYWRTSAGAEVDFIIEHKGKVIPIEVKWAERIDHYDLRGIEAFLKDFRGSADWGIVLYQGNNLLKVKDNLFLVPFDLIL